MVEREPVLRVLEQSVIFLTADNIHQVIISTRWLHTAWSVAEVGAEGGRTPAVPSTTGF